MREPKMEPTQFTTEVERLKVAGKMPSLEEVLAAVAKVRAEFAPKILAARRARRSRDCIAPRCPNR
jgi:hypothetical protein